MSKKPLAPFVPAAFVNTTCRAAVDISKSLGARIFWRPDGVINWMLPELDAAQVLEG